MTDTDLLKSARQRDEEAWETSIRPKTLDEFIGQETIKKNLSVFIQAARKREESLDHVLLAGPPGLGKTTLACIISNEMQTSLKMVAGPAVEKAGDLAAILTNLPPGGILFIDEIHRLHPSMEEILYPALEDFRLDVIIGQGPGARTMKISLPRFTMVGATTRAGLITSPLLSRFGIVHRLKLYEGAPLTDIVKRTVRPFRALRFLGRKPHTILTPHEQHRDIEGDPLPTDRYRGMHVNDWDKCIGCGVCAMVCPCDAIEMLEVEGEAKKRPEVSYGRCCFCSFCEDVCPVNSMHLTSNHTFINTDPDTFIFLPENI